MTPDWSRAPAPVPYANFHDPQSLNQYVYVRNNPTTITDPDGHEPPLQFDEFGHIKAEESHEKCGIACLFRQWLNERFNRNGQGPSQNTDPLVDGGQVLQGSAEQTGQALSAVATGIQIVDVTGISSAAQAMQKGDVFGAMSALALAFPPGGTEAKEAVTVYRIVEGEKVVYVGITNNLLRRQGEHGVPLREIVTMGSRQDARAVEQALIQQYGMQKNGGQLLNKRNSISPLFPGFWDKVKFGFDVLRSRGYIF